MPYRQATCHRNKARGGNRRFWNGIPNLAWAWRWRRIGHYLSSIGMSTWQLSKVLHCFIVHSSHIYRCTQLLLLTLRQQLLLWQCAVANSQMTVVGNDGMQKINTTMGIGWLQEHVDIPMLFHGAWILPKCQKMKDDAINISSINNFIAEAVAGTVWPLSSSESLGSLSRIMDLVRGRISSILNAITFSEF